MKKIILGLLFLASNAMASECGVMTLYFFDDYAPRILRALENKGYHLVDSLDEATYTFGGAGYSNGIIYSMEAMLTKIETKEVVSESASAILSNRALLLATKKLPRCNDLKQ
jgi:hypothetical protein